MSSIASSPSSSEFDEIATEQSNILLLEHSHEQQQGPSFAEMLRNTRTPTKPTNVWPSVVSSTQRTRTRSGAVGISDDEDVEEAYASPPSSNQCLGDALARALQQTRLEDAGIAIKHVYTYANTHAHVTVLNFSKYTFTHLDRYLQERGVTQLVRKIRSRRKRSPKGLYYLQLAWRAHLNYDYMIMIETCFCAIIICVILVMSKDPHRSLDIKSHFAKGKLSAISETIETSS